MKTRTTSQLAELGKKSDAINQLKKELSEKTTAITSLEAREKHLRHQLGATEDEFALKSSALREAERVLADKEAELAKLVAELGERSILADSQRVELASVRTQVETMKLSVADYERAVRTTEDRLTRERGDAEAAANQLNEARGKLNELATHTAELERQLVAQTTEAELLGRRVQELETRLGEQGRLLAEREFEIGQLRSELATASKIGLRDETNNVGGGGDADRFRADVSQLEAQLAAALDERAKLQREIVTMKREAETAWAAERVENALLRERINDVAAEVARLTAALEGPGSPIEAMLAAAVPGLDRGRTAGINGRRDESGATIESPQQGKGTLADRIRALQSGASRVASN
jgi:chromosome segregation ATPase